MSNAFFNTITYQKGLDRSKEKALKAPTNITHTHTHKCKWISYQPRGWMQAERLPFFVSISLNHQRSAACSRATKKLCAFGLLCVVFLYMRCAPSLGGVLVHHLYSTRTRVPCEATQSLLSNRPHLSHLISRLLNSLWIERLWVRWCGAFVCAMPPLMRTWIQNVQQRKVAICIYHVYLSKHILKHSSCLL